MKKTLIILLVISYITACKRGNIQIPTNPDTQFRNHISAYTSGIISKTDDIRIVFKDSVVTNDEGEVAKEAISTQPRFDFTTEIINGNTLHIKPTENLKSNTRHEVKIDVNVLQDSTAVTEELPVVFETLKQDYVLTALKLSPQNINEPNLLKLSGTIITDDVAELENLKKTITKIGDLDLTRMTWTQDGNRAFHFELPRIRKKEKAYTLDVKTDGKSIGQDRTWSTLIQVPAIAEFKLSSWKYQSYPDQELTLTFTETLDDKQNLNGLITLAYITKYTYAIAGNEVKLFLNNSYTGTTQLTLHEGIQNYQGKKSKLKEEIDIVIDEPLPTVEMIGEGTILPNSQGLIIPFKTIGLKKVDVDIYKIHEKNILQFLQVNDLADRDQLRRVAERVTTQTINLAKNDSTKLKQWTTHGLNLRDLITPEPGAIYRVRFSFKQPYTFCECDETLSASYQSEYYDYYENTAYENRKEYNTCENHFYYYSTRSKNVLASDLGLIIKKGADLNYTIATTNLITGKPQPQSSVQFYNYAQRRIKAITTNEQGIAKVQLDEAPFVAIGRYGKHKAYLKLYDGRANSLSKFNTEGVTRGDGVDVFFYGERGVWRPGDDIHLSFIVNDAFEKLKDNLPMKLILKNPKGQVVETKHIKLTTKGIHSTTLTTDSDAPTGNYSTHLSIGSHHFYKTLKVETVRPNRLKIKITPEEKEILGSQSQDITVSSKWLHGAIARNLKTNVKMLLSPMHTTFSGYHSYSFEDVARSFAKTERTILDGELDSLGEHTFALAPLNIQSKGKLKASLVTKVFEKGGGFSIDQHNTLYHPYSTYVGMKLPLSKYGLIPTNKTNTIQMVCVDHNGKLQEKSDTLQIKIYKLEWRWWWRHNNDDIASYVHNNSYNLVADKTLITHSGRTTYSWKIDEYNWGQYYVQVTHSNGHSTGQTVYVDYPGRQRTTSQQENARLLTLKADKNKYEAGQKAKITFPAASEGKALVSIENDIEVIKTFWVNTQKGMSSFTMTITKDMAPNCYVHITALQQHKQQDNDLPLRMYGVIPLEVFNPNTILHPRITMRKQIKPEQYNTISVSEKNGRGMYYTLAVVDDGLLDLTRFQTPNAWQHFNKKRALGVSTWDVYDNVIRSFSGKFDNVYSIGGDGAGKSGNTAKANRFKPVVKFLGPFYLKPGEKANHRIKISNYVGSVRAMVVARSGHAFGKAEHTAKVKKPLMIQANAPRILTPRDELAIPITVFATKEVTFPIKISVKGDEHLQLTNTITTINKVNHGEAVVFVKAKVLDKIGQTTLNITATCSNDNHTQSVTIPIRLPGYEIDEVQDTFITKGQTVTFDYKQLGWPNTNKGLIEVSQYPSINLDKRLRYLIQYPHGCIEQTTSSVFPQLYLSEFTSLTQQREEQIERNVQAGIKRIQKFMTMSGGFSYWPGGYDASEWGSNYAGHFLLEAKARGYYVPQHTLDKWYAYQIEKANSYQNGKSSYRWNQSELVQAYRLYTIALHGKPELGAMNRLREYGISNNTAKWRLASAYAMAGHQKTATDMVNSISYTVAPYRDDNYSYGSQYRDQAIILESMSQLQNHSELHKAMKSVATTLGSDRWLSTQETAYSLCAFGKVVRTTKKGKAAYTYQENNASKRNVRFEDMLSQQTLQQVRTTNTTTLTNTGDNPLYVRLINTGTPRTTSVQSGANGLAMNATYTDADGHQVSKDSFTFGEDYKVTVRVRNTNNKEQINNLALTTYFPAGFEIQNGALFATGETNQADYEDLRDDKVHTYFGLRPLQTKSFTYSFTASFKGHYLHPGVNCEAMYDANVYAREKGKMIVVH